MTAQFATDFIPLKRYLRWAIAQGCTVTTGFDSSDPDEWINLFVVTSPCGKRHVVIPDVSDDERLPAYEFEYFDRRLGLKSPYTEGKT